VVDAKGKILFQSVGYCPDSFDQIHRAIEHALSMASQ
jgi:hypothetical protein